VNWFTSRPILRTRPNLILSLVPDRVYLASTPAGLHLHPAAGGGTKSASVGRNRSQSGPCLRPFLEGVSSLDFSPGPCGSAGLFLTSFEPQRIVTPPEVSFLSCVRWLIRPYGGRYFPHLSRSHGSNSVRVPIYGGRYRRDMPEPVKFYCPCCETPYKVVRIEAPSANDKQLLCLGCGAPLRNREGKYALMLRQRNERQPKLV
jgi:hypothetical protein